MSFAVQAGESGRQPCVLLELELDFCELVYGQGACSASGGAGAECYNTFGTCPVTQVYTAGVKTYRYAPADRLLPHDLDAYPALLDVDFAGAELEPGTLGVRATAKVTVKDFPDDDVGVDPYVDTRTYTPSSQGTHIGKLKARNPHYFGRPGILREGYLTEPFSDGLFRDRKYVIESIDGPNGRDRGVIRLADPLIRLDDERSQVPKPSPYTLANTLSVGSTTLVFSTAAIASYYFAADPHLAINKEIVKTGSLSGNSILGITRAVYGTEADHNAGDQVQECWTVSGNVVPVMQELLTRFSNIASADLDYAAWTAEQSETLGSFNLFGVLPEPTGCDEVGEEIIQTCMLNVYWDEYDQSVKLRHDTPWATDVTSMGDELELVADSVTVRDRHDLRVTRAVVHYGMIDPFEDLEVENFSRVHETAVESLEGADAFDGVQRKTFFARFFPGDTTTAAELLANRTVARYQETPREITWQIDAKDVSSANLADVLTLSTRKVQDATGANKPVRVQVTKIKPEEPAHLYEYRGLAYQGQPTEEPLIISANTHDLNIDTLLSQPPNAVDVTVVVYPGVMVWGDPAITDLGLPPGSTVTLVCCGTVAGNGGVGGDGGDGVSRYISNGGVFKLYVNSATPGTDGEDGKDALDVHTTWTIRNDAGEIFGGGGGGGGGGGAARDDDGAGGGGGGTGQGGTSIAGGVGGDLVTITDLSSNSLQTGVDGDAGDYTAPGSGGDGPTGPGSSYDAGDGGLAGAFGAAGNAGQTGTGKAFAAGGAAGAGGYAVRVHSGGSVNFESGFTSSRVKGSVGS